MYKLSVKQWNPFRGCLWNCAYCRSSFQAQLKRWAGSKDGCQKCYNYAPHPHPEKLTQTLPETRYMQFIFVCACGDIAFCRRKYLEKIVARIREEKTKTFLIQSKYPRSFERVNFPDNVVLGTTIETNRDELYCEISKAPRPSQRYRDFKRIEHPLKMVTMEPLVDFDLDVIVDWTEGINPCMTWLGYDSKSNFLPEPELDKVKALYWELGRRGFTVILKTVRRAWWEQPII